MRITGGTIVRRICVVTALIMMLLSAAVSADAVPGTGGWNRPEPATVPVYLFYSRSLKDYFLTASETEKSSLESDQRTGKQTYEYIGVLGYAEETASSCNVPVYRFWNKDTTDHFYTISEAEKKQVEEDYRTGRDGYKYEGVGFYVPAYGNTPVYRFFDTVNFSHLYITDEATKEQLTTAYENGRGNCRYEGIAWYW